MAIALGAAHSMSAVGEGLAASFERMRTGGTAITGEGLHGSVAHVGRMQDGLQGSDRLFTILDRCIEASLSQLKGELDPRRTQWIISSTKGDIAALDRGEPEQAALTTLADHMQRAWNTASIPWVVSNACASGTSAIALGGQLIRAEQADHVIVVGIDLLSRFVLDGFRSLYALSAGPCRPFDATRDGTSLGEACAVVVMSNDPSIFSKPLGTLHGSGVAHDANHISGPSRTGEGLMRAVRSAMRMSSIRAEEITVVNAHATGTAYNDAMESVAFDRCGLSHVPISGYKGWFGHTLGAAGILETIIALHALQQSRALRNEGHQKIDPALQVNVLNNDERVTGDVLLKTSSGFGGCNAALILRAWKN
jgi:3-oxoacyl-[acyl-carrier-protein] synthase I